MAGFSEGFKLGYRGPRMPRDADCLMSAKKNVEATWKKLEKEIALGRIIGPYKSRPLSNLQCSPIGLIPKQQPGEWRLITHLSFPSGNSINDGIPAEIATVKYATFDSAVELVQQVGSGAFLAKCDIKSAFRLLPIYPGDFDLLGFKFEQLFFIDRCLPMGSSISCSHFECFSSYLEYQIKVFSKTDFITHYLDDFLFIQETSAACQRVLEKFKSMCRQLGVPLAEEKTEGPSTRLTYLGLEIDTVAQVVKIPHEKVSALLHMLRGALEAEEMQLKKIQALIGSLNFVCRAIPPGRAFLRRLIGLTIGFTEGSARIRVGTGAKRDIAMWIEFLTHFNGAVMFLESQWVSNSTLELYTDAAQSIGFGCFFQNHWTCSLWPSSVQARSTAISYLELYPLVVAIELWGNLMCNKKVKFWCDNQAVVAIVNKKSAKCPRTMILVRRFVLCALKHNILFRASYVEGSYNGIADALSRFQEARFRHLAPNADMAMTPLPAWVQ